MDKGIGMKKLCQVLAGEAMATSPIWLMRQAGRYLPEYQAVRAQAGSFLDLVYDPVRAAEVTVQPIRRFGFDAAILFADILVVPQAMGVDVRFTTSEGPVLKPVCGMDDIVRLNDVDRVGSCWAPIMETVSRVRAQLNQEGFADRALIGFAGAPWTLACYMVAGGGQDHEFVAAKMAAWRDPAFFSGLVDQTTDVTIAYLAAQVAAGAEVIQIFDSWAGVASGDLFDQYVVTPTKKIVQSLRAQGVKVPIIGFPRLSGHRAVAYVQATGIDALSVDTIADLSSLRQMVPGMPLQGNLDPVVLRAGGKALDREVDRIVTAMAGAPFIFNLGHGVMKETPIDHVSQLVARVRGGAA